MKKVIASLGLMAMASVSNAAVVDLGLHPFCNGNGDYLGSISFGGGQNFLRCELPTQIAVGNDTVVLAKTNQFSTTPIVWTLPGVVVVGDGSNQNANPATVDRTELRIEAGAQVAGAVDSNSALVISRGASIYAVGNTKNENGEVISVDPIVFSSLDDNYNGSGEWGGLVLAGFGENNNCPSADGVDSCEMEGVAPGNYYGGGAYLNETMSSGTLEHVVIAEGGHTVAQDSEINGLTLYSVNSTTAISDIHVHNNADDGVEFFGGDANVDRVWLTCNEDDSVDWDEGYRGAITDLSILQAEGSYNAGEPAVGPGYAFELAGNPNDPSSQPKANGSVTNATVTLQSGLSVQPDEVFNLKQGTMGSFSNIKIEGYAGIGCDVITSNSSGSFSALAYDCVPANIPASTSATGFDEASFWSAPACD